MKAKHKLFVYGTLRDKDTPATHSLPGYAMFDYGKFPYIEEDYDGSGQVVYGNVVDVDDLELAELDRYEGLGTKLYKRVKEKVYPVGERGKGVIEAYVYVGDRILPAYVESGDWFKRGNGSKH